MYIYVCNTGKFGCWKKNVNVLKRDGSSYHYTSEYIEK